MKLSLNAVWCDQIYRSVLLSSRHHSTDQPARCSSPATAAVKDERKTRKTSSGNYY